MHRATFDVLTYCFAPPYASLANEPSEVGLATPDLIFSL